MSIDIKNEQVFVKRLNPLRFLIDPAVSISNIDEAKWVGRVIDIPYMDLIEDKKLDVDKSLKGFAGYGDRIGRKTNDKRIFERGKDYSLPKSSWKTCLVPAA